MKAVIWKELRQLAPWCALMLAALLSAVVWYMTYEYGWNRRTKAMQEVHQLVILSSMGVALFLGFFQAGLEVSRDRWAFLLHRGVSATRLFLAKVFAGLLMYGLVTLIPILVGAIFCASGGVELYPFTWRQTLPGVAFMISSTGFYFAAMLATIWKAPWRVVRALPLVLAFCIVLATGMMLDADFVFLDPLGLSLVVATIGSLAVGSWGVFIRSGEAVGRPASATFGLALGLFLAVGGAVGGLIPGVLEIQDWYRLVVQRMSNRSVNSGYVIRSDGHICRVETDSSNPSQSQKITSFVDLDQPNPKRDASLLGRNLMDLNDPAVFQPFHEMTLAYHHESRFWRLLRGGVRRPIMEDLGTTSISLNQQPTQPSQPISLTVKATSSKAGPTAYVEWIFSEVDGWIYGYLGHLAPQRRLAYIIGPDGVVLAPQRPKRRFPKMLVDARQSIQRNVYKMWPAISGVSFDLSQRMLLLFEDGLYVVDLDALAIQQLLTAPEGQKIRSLKDAPDGVAVVYDNSIAVHAARPDSLKMPIPANSFPGHAQRTPGVLKLPDRLLYSFPIPKEITDFELFSFGRVPGQDVVLFTANQKGINWRTYRFVHMKLDGTVINTHDALEKDDFIPSGLSRLMASELLLPSGLVAFALVADSIKPALTSPVKGMLAQLWEMSPRETLLLMGELLGVAILCAWLAGRKARRYAFNPGERRVWQCAAFLLGPGGLLTLMLLRDWPILAKCPACGKKWPVNRDRCPCCEAPASAPSLNGTEILELGVT